MTFLPFLNSNYECLQSISYLWDLVIWETSLWWQNVIHFLQLIHSADSDNCVRKCCPSIRTFQNLGNQNKFQRKQCSLLARLWVWSSGSLMTPVLFYFFSERFCTEHVRVVEKQRKSKQRFIATEIFLLCCQVCEIWPPPQSKGG